MDMFTSKGTAGQGVSYASFALIGSLLTHLEKSGTLIPADVRAILDHALAQIPANNISAREDARKLIESLKR